MIKRLELMIEFLVGIQVKLMLLAMASEDVPDDLHLSITKGNELVEQLFKVKELAEEHADLLKMILEEKETLMS